MNIPSKTFGYINGGGPAPCACAVLAGEATVLKDAGHRLLAIPRGWAGMQEVQPDIFHITDWTRERIQQLIPESGMPIPTDRAKIDPDKAEQTDKLMECWKAYELDGLLTNGGDDTAKTARILMEKLGLSIIHVPKTIDNDICVEEWNDNNTFMHQTYGWETAVNTAKERLLKLRHQIRSTERVGVGEIMGRKSGLITLFAGKAAGADITLIRECPIPTDILYARICEIYDWQRNVLIAIAEAYEYEGTVCESNLKDVYGQGHLGGIASVAGDDISENVRVSSITDREKKVKVGVTKEILGYHQQVDDPLATDAVRAYRIGAHAAYLALTGKFGRMATMRGGITTDVDLSRVKGGQEVPVELYDPQTMSMRDLPVYMDNGVLKVRQ